MSSSHREAGKIYKESIIALCASPHFKYTQLPRQTSRMSQCNVTLFYNEWEKQRKRKGGGGE